MPSPFNSSISSPESRPFSPLRMRGKGTFIIHELTNSLNPLINEMSWTLYTRHFYRELRSLFRINEFIQFNELTVELIELNQMNRSIPLISRNKLLVMFLAAPPWSPSLMRGDLLGEPINGTPIRGCYHVINRSSHISPISTKKGINWKKFTPHLHH